MKTYALPVDSGTIKRSGTLSRFPTAVHSDHAVCIPAAHSIRSDFASQVDMDIDAKTIGDYPELGPVHVVAFTIPDCLPDRLALMTRFTDFTIMNDDYYDAVDMQKVTAFNAGLQRSLEGPEDPANDGTSVPTETKRFQASILVEMMTVDRNLAMDVMTTYSNGLQIATCPPSHVSSLEEYLPIRLINCGLDVFQEMSCFGMGLKLKQAEKCKLSEIVNTALYTAALINDCHSWPKELNHHLNTPDSEPPFNAVCIVMRQYECSDTEAIERVQEKYVELQERHLLLVRELERDEGVISEAHRKYIMAAQYAASGSEFWSIFAPRYPTKEDLEQPECLLIDDAFQWRDASRYHRSHVNGVTGNSKTDLTGSNGDASLAMPSSLSAKTIDHGAVRAPYNYISTLPSKKIRETFIDALDSWLEVPVKSSSAIKSIIGMLHHASLMLDDVEDDSMLRRGRPTAHTLFGAAQTINSANFVFVCAFEGLQQLANPEAVGVFVEELKKLHCGQALDLHWKYHTNIPSVEEYANMVDHKTGGLFRLCARLMQGESCRKIEHIDADRFVTLLGRYFQIRDDYQNLISDEYTSQKGFCEDLDEGKISLPLILCLAGSDPEQTMIKGILQHKKVGEMPIELKTLILGNMRREKVLESILVLLRDLQEDILKELKLLEAAFGSENPILELVLRRLWV
ncbi:hypothetical protein KC354_g2138 [Hortaea werneckii]|nr:hypothetical protein KC354_g2138 [Hortaea werneckii]